MYDETTYNLAVSALAQQLVAMAIEDGDTPEEVERYAEYYAGEADCDVIRKVRELLEQERSDI